MIDFYDNNRYRTRRFFNRLWNAIWSIIVMVLLLVGAVILYNFCLPWLQTLWETVK